MAQEIFVRIALMQEHRLAQASTASSSCQRKASQLRVARREVTEVVEPAFADGDDFGLPRRGPQVPLSCAASRSVGVMRMNAAVQRKRAGSLRTRCDGGARARDRAAGDHHARDADVSGPPMTSLTIVVEAVVRQVDADVDELGGATRRRSGLPRAKRACAIVRA